MTHGELYEWLKHNNDYIHITKNGYDVSFNVYDKGECQWVVFEESIQKTDWISNFNFIPTRWQGLTVHRGYVGQYMIVRDILMGMVSADKPTYCIGWSLGGALAALCAYDLQIELRLSPTLITYGSPKVCWNRKSAGMIRQAISEESVQYRNVNDLVVYMPPIGFWNICGKSVGLPFDIRKLVRPSTQHNAYEQLIP